MSIELVVVRAFGAHAVGDRIVDGAAVAATLASENAHRVVRVAPVATLHAPASTTGKGG